MRRADEILLLARQQRTFLIECLLEELEGDGLTEALQAAICANDQLVRVLESICRDGPSLSDDAVKSDA